MNAMLKTGALAALTVTLLGGCASYTGQTNDPNDPNRTRTGALIGAGIGLGVMFGNYFQGALRNPTAAAQERPMLFLGMALTGKVVPYKVGFGPFPGDALGRTINGLTLLSQALNQPEPASLKEIIRRAAMANSSSGTAVTTPEKMISALIHASCPKADPCGLIAYHAAIPTAGSSRIALSMVRPGSEPTATCLRTRP